jgi:hypothetical protein
MIPNLNEEEKEWWDDEMDRYNRRLARARLAGPLKFGFLFIALVFFCFVLASKCHAQSRVVGVPDSAKPCTRCWPKIHYEPVDSILAGRIDSLREEIENLKRIWYLPSVYITVDTAGHSETHQFPSLQQMYARIDSLSTRIRVLEEKLNVKK